MNFKLYASDQALERAGLTPAQALAILLGSLRSVAHPDGGQLVSVPITGFHDEPESAKQARAASQEDLRQVMQGMLSLAAQDASNSYQLLADHPTMIKARELLDKRDWEGFFFLVLYPIGETFDGLLDAVFPGSNYVKFIFKHSDFIENAYQKLFERIEGSACCADKSRTIVNALIHHFLTGQEIQFNYAGEYTYHLPAKIFREHAEIVEFFESLVGLYYGRHERYLKALASVLTSAKQEPAAEG